MTTTGILLLTTLLQLLLFHIPASSAKSDRVICRAKHYVWVEVNHKNGVIFPSPESLDGFGTLLEATRVDMTSENNASGIMYLAKFRSIEDGSIQLAIVKPNGTMSFTNNANIVGKLELLMETRRATSAGNDQYFAIWPGTMRSSYRKNSPDLREATFVVGVENNQLVYLGLAVIGKNQFPGKIVEDAYGKYELIYRDVDQVEKRTDQFMVLVSKDCSDRFD